MHENTIINLISVLRSGESTGRMAAAEALAAIGSIALPDLTEALDDPDPRLRMWAAYTLGMLGDAEAVPALIQALDDSDPGVRKWAIAALRRIKDTAGGCGCRFC
ncbi:MAG: HEAT repeat domain-containing protein [Methanoculleus sp.]|jgi:HEAT repeat protein|nr:HEAT repeat domain-containing protein [Methanomicrobiales archaeon]NQS73346.1 HEAT repeat domain-containing protein [Methanoculleus sp.]